MHLRPFLHDQRALANHSLTVAAQNDCYRAACISKRFLAALLLASMPAAFAQVGLGLAPMRLEFGAAAGAQHSGVLTLVNDSGATVRVRTELLDFSVDSSQTPQFEPSLPSEEGLSCRDWLAVNPMETELGVGQQLLIRYTIRVPQSAASPRSYHCAAGFSTLPTAGQLGANGIRTAVRVVSAFYVVVGKPAIEGGFKDMKLVRHTNSDQKPVWFGEVVMQNFSYMHFRPVGELSILDAAGKVVESAKFVPMPVLPKREQRLLVPFKSDLAPGTYTLRARVDTGNNQIEEGTAVVSAGGVPQ
jgi:hypothetical protein